MCLDPRVAAQPPVILAEAEREPCGLAVAAEEATQRERPRQAAWGSRLRPQSPIERGEERVERHHVAARLPRPADELSAHERFGAQHPGQSQPCAAAQELDPRLREERERSQRHPSQGIGACTA